MFPIGPQRQQYPNRPVRPHPFFQAPKQTGNFFNSTTKQNLFALFQTDDGSLDIDKISGTVEQISKIYSQVSPMISQFRRK